jgi:uncharacterized membrane protein
MIQLQNMSLLQAALLFVALALPVVWLGMRTMDAIGPVRKWVAIGARVVVLLLAVLILAGIRIERANKDVAVMVLRDVSRSTQLVDVRGGNLRKAVDDYLKEVVEKDEERKKGTDRIGLISFDEEAYVDASPNPELVLDARATRDNSSGTDVSKAIQLGIASMPKDAMHRMVLIWDGNATLGNLEEAITQAASKHIPIDVMPLQYAANDEVIVERFVSPPWRRENEPFSIDVYLRSTNKAPVSGNLRVRHQGVDMDLDPQTAGLQPTRTITVTPGTNRATIQVPALDAGGVHQFEAIFEAPNVTTELGGQKKTSVVGDTIRENNVASTFTFVRGKGRVLLVNNVPGDQGKYLLNALTKEGITIDADRTGVDQFPTSLVELQNYDAVILSNVPRGSSGLSDQQQEMLASYVRDMGGGLLMIGGPEAFGAGGWQGSKLEEVLPVSMDIPATRMIPKGALVLIMHSCEMPNGNYWGSQCAIKAAEVLSPRDEIGVLSYAWNNGRGSAWDYPLAARGDGTKVIAAIKNMQLGDMPDFDDAMDVALNGTQGQPGLKDSDARQKHVIIISDGDPQAPNPQLIKAYQDQKISVSTISVFPHELPIPKTMQDIANKTLGKAYGPIESNPSQLPQIFVKEATVVRRTLILEENEGLAVKDNGSMSDLVKGLRLDQLPPLYGLVLTSKKQAPQIEMPLTVGPNSDPLLAHWQVGLGKVAVFTSDAHPRWAANWVGMNAYDKFWAQIVRGVSKPGESSDFDVRVNVQGDRGKITVEAVDQNTNFQNFLNIRGTVVGPDMKPIEVKLQQVRPGVYETDFQAGEAGNYVVGLAYQGSDGKSGVMRSGTVVNTSPELRDLRTNLAALQEVATRTGGRMLDAFTPTGTSYFTREGLAPSRSPLPIWDLLLPLLMALVLTDIAIRRIAWDWNATKQMAAATVAHIRGITTLRKVETTGSLDALRDVKAKVTERKTGQTRSVEAGTPDPSFKFEAKQQTTGNLADIVGGATDKPLPKGKTDTSTPKGQQGDKPNSGGGMSGLLEAKKRAQEKIREREEGKQ